MRSFAYQCDRFSFSGVIGGAAALSPADVEQAWLFRDPPGTANEPAALTGTISVTKTFDDSREISLTPKCWWLKRPREDWLANSGCSPALRVNEGQATATDHAAPNEVGVGPTDESPGPKSD